MFSTPQRSGIVSYTKIHKFILPQTVVINCGLWKSRGKKLIIELCEKIAVKKFRTWFFFERKKHRSWQVGLEWPCKFLSVIDSSSMIAIIIISLISQKRSGTSPATCWRPVRASIAYCGNSPLLQFDTALIDGTTAPKITRFAKLYNFRLQALHQKRLRNFFRPNGASNALENIFISKWILVNNYLLRRNWRQFFVNNILERR